VTEMEDAPSAAIVACAGKEFKNQERLLL
jgi:hypothetical protein